MKRTASLQLLALAAAVAAGAWMFEASGASASASDAEAAYARIAAAPHPRGGADPGALARAAARLGEAPLPEREAAQESRRTLDAVSACALTGKDRYCKDALRRARHIAAWNPRGATAYDRDPQAAVAVARALAAAYDRLAPKLGAAQKNLLLSPLRMRAADIARDLGAGLAGAGARHALARITVLLAGDVPEARAWASTVHQVATKREGS